VNMLQQHGFYSQWFRRYEYLKYSSCKQQARTFLYKILGRTYVCEQNCKRTNSMAEYFRVSERMSHGVQ
jgi:hypothetical protein